MDAHKNCGRRSNRLKIVTLASGSSGNSTFIEMGGARFLIDCGISCRRIEKSLNLLGIPPDTLDAIIITHEHNDHIRGLPIFNNRYNIPIFVSHKLASKGQHLDFLNYPGTIISEFQPGEPFMLDGIEITPFSLPHDVIDHVGFRIAGEDGVLTHATDIGHITKNLIDYAYGSDYLLIEANYDDDMLWNGPYPIFLKNRISGPLGHLSNEDCCDVLEQLIHPELLGIVLVHMSKENNATDIVLDSVLDIAGDIPIGIAPRNEPKDWIPKL